VRVDPFSVDPESPLTAWGQVDRDLRRRIEVLEFEPGARLPAEADLARYYGVSRVTIRRALESLVSDGLLITRRGAGTYVPGHDRTARFDVDLLRPWREQLLATGHAARSRLIEVTEVDRVPPALRRWIGSHPPAMLLLGHHVQEVDGLAVAITESWIPTDGDAAVVSHPRSALVSTTATVRVSFADGTQAAQLACHRDATLLEVVSCSRLRETGEVIELARTSWMASRVSPTFGRTLVVGQIDMSELLAHASGSERRPRARDQTVERSGRSSDMSMLPRLIDRP
jgi:DNA-binding GntR family transcriptional regulator